MGNRQWTYCEIVRSTTIVIVGTMTPEEEPGGRALALPALPALPSGLLDAPQTGPRAGAWGKWGRLALSLAGLAVAGALAAGRRGEVARALPGRPVRALPAPVEPDVRADERVMQVA